MAGRGNLKNPDVVVVGDGPSKQEALSHKTFADERGRLLIQALEEIGIPVGDDGVVFATYAAKCFPAGKVGVRDARKCAEAYLWRELDMYKPKMIIALGKIAQLVVLGLAAPISKTHGKLYDLVREDANGNEWTAQVMPVEHPFSILSTPAKLDPWIADLRRAKMTLFSEGSPYWTPEKMERFNFELIDSEKRFKEVARQLITEHRGDYLAIDIEASGLDDAMPFPDYRVFTLQFGIVDTEDKEANDTLPVYILPIQSEHFTICDNPMWLDRVRFLLNNFLHPRYFKLVAHNAKYDIKGLRTVGITEAFADRDTVMLWANVHGEAPLSLKEIAYQVSDLGGYEKDMEEYFEEYQTYDAPPNILLPYGGLDIVVTRHLMFELEQTIMKETQSDPV